METNASRNPFGVMDVPEPNDEEVVAFAATARFDGGGDEPNAEAWSGREHRWSSSSIEGEWSSRWNGGADPTVPGDVPEKWKSGSAELRCVGGRVYIRFDWHEGKRCGLIDAERQGANRLVGKYINLTNPSITRPWAGVIVSDERIDGHWTNGRLDFRR